MQPDDEQIGEAIARRDRYMRRVRENRSVEERIAAFVELQQAAFRVLRESPDAYQHFLRRNMRSRRVKVIDGKYIPVSPARRAQLP